MAAFPQSLYQSPDWPAFHWDAQATARNLAEIHFRRGLLLASLTSLGFQAQQDSLIQTLVSDVVRSSKIEGERLDELQVRSSVVRRLGLDVAGLPRASRDVDGVVEMMLDATQNYTAPLTETRLFGWHAALFPTGYSGQHKLEVAQWRSDQQGPMQVVGGPLGQQKVHFEAPPATKLPEEMRRFIHWIENDQPLDPVVKAGLAHLWFLTLHPFEDGNGRIARALSDMLLARADGRSERFYSISSQIEAHRRSYYEVLERTQRRTSLDVTDWLIWFTARLLEALQEAEVAFEKVRLKRCFWDRQQGKKFNGRQQRLLELLFEDFYGKLQTQKYARLMKCSPATAQRDLSDLVAQGALITNPISAGRNTSYQLNLAGCEGEHTPPLYQPNR